jgi:dipeptidyl aminopeptidase/acylaminoacyl peptidase
MVNLNKFKDLISVPLASFGLPNSDGTKVAYLSQKANWKEDQYNSNIFIFDVKTATTHQLTNSNSVNSMDWWKETDLLVLMPDSNKKLQLFLYRGLIGDPIKLTNEKEGISSFKVCQDGIIYLSSDPDKFKLKQRSDKFGDFKHIEEETAASKLMYFPIEEMIKFNSTKESEYEDISKNQIEPLLNLTTQMINPLHIYNFDCSTDGSKILISGTEKADLIFMNDRINYILTINFKIELQMFIESENAKKKKDQSDKNSEAINSDEADNKEEEVKKFGDLTKLNLPYSAFLVIFSPDGNNLLINFQERDTKFYTQADLWLISFDKALKQDISQSDLFCLTREIDQSIMSSQWTDKGIYLTYFENTRSKIILIDPLSLKREEIKLQDNWNGWMVRANKSGDFVTLAFHEKHSPELIFQDRNGISKFITQTSLLIEEVTKKNNLELIPVETIEWESKDGTIIHGVIRKPRNFNPKKKYPLVFIVHGGPSWISYETALSGQDIRYYPSVQFSNNDIICVYPNYRGSIGKGQSFLELNVNNLGVGDLWDIESCIDFLDNQGFIDTSKIGCMGWSQGGYISAMAATHSNKFAATSVGAGISDWYSYWMTTDIRLFTHDYLSGNPLENRLNYQKTSPMSSIQNANTPTLIQIGENDQRVPLVNATELYRALKLKGVATQLFVFTGMPHGITKPRENLAVIVQNYQWFNHYLLGKELDLTPAIDDKKSE